MNLPTLVIHKLKKLLLRKIQLDEVLQALRQAENKYLSDINPLESIYRSTQSTVIKNHALDRAQKLTAQYIAQVNNYKQITEFI